MNQVIRFPIDGILDGDSFQSQLWKYPDDFKERERFSSSFYHIEKHTHTHTCSCIFLICLFFSCVWSSETLFAVQIIFDVIKPRRSKRTDVMLYSARKKRREETRNIVIHTHTRANNVRSTRPNGRRKETRIECTLKRNERKFLSILSRCDISSC